MEIMKFPLVLYFNFPFSSREKWDGSMGKMGEKWDGSILCSFLKHEPGCYEAKN